MLQSSQSGTLLMRARRNHPHITAAVLLLALGAGGGAAGCSSSSASGQVDQGLGAGDAASGSRGGPCVYASRPIGAGDMTSLGVTASELLTYVSGTREATLTWGTASPDQQVTVTPAGTTQLTIEVTPKTDGVTISEADAGLCGPATLSIPATVSFRTSDGGFDESWQVSLYSNDGRSLAFNQSLQMPPPAGTFRVTYTGSETWTSTETTLTATFDSQGARGDVLYVTEMQFSTGPNSGGGGGLIVHAASWVPSATDAGSPAND